MATHELALKVLFQHCDPHGIVFYPRYFEMINQTVEDWFERALDYPFARMQGALGRGVPTVALEAKFHAPSRLGEVLTFALGVEVLGRTSLTLRVNATAAQQDRITARFTLVHVDKSDDAPLPWEDALRRRISAYTTATVG